MQQEGGTHLLAGHELERAVRAEVQDGVGAEHLLVWFGLVWFVVCGGGDRGRAQTSPYALHAISRGLEIPICNIYTNTSTEAQGCDRAISSTIYT